MSDALFRPDGEVFLPTELARGPWSSDAQHGGAPAALLARAIERFEGGETMHVARLTVELLRPVPIAPLTLTTRWSRPGRKVQLVEATLRHGETDVARATGLRIRRAELPLPDGIDQGTPPAGPTSGGASLPPWEKSVDWGRAYHSHAVEHRFVAGSFSGPGPSTDWIRLRVPVVEGEEPSQLCRVAAAADFGNGISWVLSRNDGWQFINPDLTIYLHRYPIGEWVCLDARTWVQPLGVGLAESGLWDEHGTIGRALQSLLIERV
ncbi:MAG TPA: thioesterase family protein [Candidatus Binatia bacterium]|jgi:hypothetical protein|nr:thioesterase family protein [Candidatus Binatia bacterium]